MKYNSPINTSINPLRVICSLFLALHIQTSNGQTTIFHSIEERVSAPQLPNPFQQQQVSSQNMINQRNSSLIVESDQNILHQQEQELIDLKELEETEGAIGDSFYTPALNELLDMVSGKTKYNFAKAAFIPENAFFNNQLKFEQYEKLIKEKVRLARLIMKREKLDTTQELSKNYAIQKLFTTSVNEKRNDGTLKTTKPMTYEFEDYLGQKNLAQTFSFKLLNTGKGQCYSMPIITKAIANELKTRAYLAYSPSHIYTKFVDANEQFYNFETTNGSNTTDQFMTESGYVSATAMRNKMYLDTLSQKRELSMFISQLATGYIRKYGYRRFAVDCTNKALELDSTNISAMMILANFYTSALNNGIRYYHIKNEQELNSYPDLVQLKALRDEHYIKIDRLGYQPMPETAYNNWLKKLNTEKVKQQSVEFQKSMQQQLQHLKQ
jgi:hypothetical protein